MAAGRIKVAVDGSDMPSKAGAWAAQLFSQLTAIVQVRADHADLQKAIRILMFRTALDRPTAKRRAPAWSAHPLIKRCPVIRTKHFGWLPMSAGPDCWSGSSPSALRAGATAAPRYRRRRPDRCSYFALLGLRHSLASEKIKRRFLQPPSAIISPPLNQRTNRFV